MAQYIDKSALIEEIERRTDELYDLLPNASKAENGTITISEACNTGKYTALESFRNYIDTLEAKEVDLDKELNKYFIANNLVALDIQFEPIIQMKKCAQYFFELGIKAQKGK